MQASTLRLNRNIPIWNFDGASAQTNLVNRIFETSDAFDSQRLIVTFIKTNSNTLFPLCNDRIIYLEVASAAQNFFRHKLGALAFKSRLGSKQLSYSKISFVLGKDCSIFCEGVGEVVISLPPLINMCKYDNEIIKQQFSQIFDDNGNAVSSQLLVGLSQTQVIYGIHFKIIGILSKETLCQSGESEEECEASDKDDW